ncbi:MAG: immunity 53 family protein [Acidobacteriaceae bacterium]|nr:immunity 53 family protein [Acidobacteriaceae bacterium]
MSVTFLQTWYQQQCDGFWEHAYGVTIESLDTPGWMMTVDLTDTPLANATMETVRQERSETDWLICAVAHQKFQGQGDPQKLGQILQVFKNWAAASGAGA